MVFTPYFEFVPDHILTLQFAVLQQFVLSELIVLPFIIVTIVSSLSLCSCASAHLHMSHTHTMEPPQLAGRHVD